MKLLLRYCCLACLVLLALTACTFSLSDLPFFQEETAPTPSPTPPALDQMGVNQVIGYIYDQPSTYYEKYDHNLVLYDLSGLLDKDREWKMEPENMVIGHAKLDGSKIHYVMDLPLYPKGIYHDIDLNPKETGGVQIFTYWLADNFMGTAFLESEEQPSGWPLYNTAVKFDPNDSTRIVEGWLLVWAENNQTMFPVAVGDDGILFTEDDDYRPLLAGYTSVHLQDGVLTWDRSREVEINITAPYDQRVYDLSHKDAFTAYTRTLKILEEDYPGWKEEVTADELSFLKNDLSDEMNDAAKADDQQAVTQIFGRLVSVLDNGMVQLSGSQDDINLIKQAYPADFGFSVNTMSDGMVRVTAIRSTSPTFNTSLGYGDVILEVDGQPVDDVINEQPISFFPNGDPETLRRLQEIFFLRKPEGEKMRLKIRNMLGEEESLTLTSSADTVLLERALPNIFSQYSRSGPPIRVEEINDFGVFHIYDMDTDPELTVQMFAAAARTFDSKGIEKYVIDLQNASGSTFLQLAGYFTTEPIQVASYACGDDYTWNVTVAPKGILQWTNSLHVIVGSGCKGACELEALAFSKISGAIIYGFSPTYGAFDTGIQAKIQLPNDMTLSYPICHMTEIGKPKAQLENVIIPDVVLNHSMIETINGPEAVINQVIYAQMKKDFKSMASRDMRALTLGELYAYYSESYGVNYLLEEDEDQYYYYHDVPSYDMHITNHIETNGHGTFEFMPCEDSYNKIQKIQNSLDISFAVDFKDVPNNDVLNRYYQPGNSQYCTFWILGINAYPAGYHEISMQIDVSEPVVMYGSLWEPGTYEFNYQFFLYKANGDE